MTIASEISKLQTNLENSYTAIETKGGTLPEHKNFDNLSTAIDSISSGSDKGTTMFVENFEDTNPPVGYVHLLNMNGNIEGSSTGTLSQDANPSVPIVTNQGKAFYINNYNQYLRQYSYTKQTENDVGEWSYKQIDFLRAYLPDYRHPVYNNKSTMTFIQLNSDNVYVVDYEHGPKFLYNRNYQPFLYCRFRNSDGYLTNEDGSLTYNTGFGGTRNSQILVQDGKADDVIIVSKIGKVSFIHTKDFPNCTQQDFTFTVTSGNLNLGVFGYEEIGCYYAMVDNKTLKIFKYNGTTFEQVYTDSIYTYNTPFVDQCQRLICYVNANRMPKKLLLDDTIIDCYIPNDDEIQKDLLLSTGSYSCYFVTNRIGNYASWFWRTGTYNNYQKICAYESDYKWRLFDSSTYNYTNLGGMSPVTSSTCYATGETDADGKYEVATGLRINKDVNVLSVFGGTIPDSVTMYGGVDNIVKSKLVSNGIQYYADVYSGTPMKIVANKNRYYSAISYGNKVYLNGMTPYTGLNMSYYQGTGYLMTVKNESGESPDYKILKSNLGCMATAGQSYSVKTIGYINYTTAGTPIIDTQTGIVSGFSTSNYLKLPQSFPANVQFKAIFNVTFKKNTANTDGQALFTKDSENKSFYVQHSSSLFGIWDGTKGFMSSTALIDGTKYWLGIDYDYSTKAFKFYLLVDDGTYNIDTLPDFSNWSEEINATLTSDIFSSTLFRIGSNPKNSYIWRGDVDLKGCRIYINDEIWWSPLGEYLTTADGLLPDDVIDDGTAQTWNLFYNQSTKQYRLTTSDTLTDYIWCGEVALPAHTV